MPVYNSIKEFDETAEALRALAGIEPIVVDSKLVALEVGGLRIAPEKGGSLQVWLRDEQP